jgi:hypothetical protein
MKLSEYLRKTSIKHVAFAKKCGIKKSCFSRYVNGSRKPPLEVAEKIKKESRNMVTEFDFIIFPS